jgi:3-(methylthio)propanoyl-CoA dehydrogenase
MTEYTAPLRDMQFLLRHLVDLPGIVQLPVFEHLEADTLTEVLEQAATFATEVLSPLNVVGDRQGSRLTSEGVRTPQGWRDAYQRFAADGWAALGCSTEIGGHGLPAVIAVLAEEMWQGANPAFALCPMLTHSAIEALNISASEELKERYFPHLVQGRWTGTMDLTEPQAGSDLAAIKSVAIPQSDGTFRIKGQKIFITYGEHDLTENTIHLALARTPTAPPGVKGISLFAVPRVLSNSDGTLTTANALRCVSLEHKLGIHASPTCVMQYGSDDGVGATGWLLGEENRGLEYMFIMMNSARLSVGVQGLGMAERAYQQAVSYARERRQGRDPEGNDTAPIIHHPDVRRMLLTMRASTEAMRALICAVAEAVDLARSHPEAVDRERAQELVALMTPVVKGWCTETAVQLASMAIQVYGGTGYVEESGAPQLLRDARISTIYEGTTGIQANDLVNRKLRRDRGKAALELVAAMQPVQARLARSESPHLQAIAPNFERAIGAFAESVRFIAEDSKDGLPRALAAAVPLLELFGVVCGGWQLSRAALAAEQLRGRPGADVAFCEAKLLTARFYGDHILPRAEALKWAVVCGNDAVLRMPESQF